jgi:hypothetical protein
MSEANNQDQQVQEPDYLNMSDDEIRNMTGPVPSAASANAEEEDKDDDQENADNGGAQDNQSASDSNDNQSNDDDENAENDDDEAAGKPAEEESGDGEDANKDGQQANQADTPNAGDAADGQKDSEKADEKKPEDESTIDFKSEYERLLTPFKANGRDIKVNNVDEAITLMQMGANYNKKMAALKPNLKLMKLLEKSGLLSEEKISFLIDLNRKDPAAINKLVNDSGIDPMDLTADKASAYKQTAYTVDDREIELDTVLDELQDSPSYNRTLEIVGTKWDAASKQVVAGNPAIMRVINDHVSSGIYDRIQKEIDNERMFGRLIGLSDIEAYRQVGDALHAKGAFNSLVQGSSQPKQQTPPAQKVVVQPKPKQDDDDKRKDKKRAASSTKSVVSNSQLDFNPLSMSDEEFAKHVNKQFL